jgi:glycosyltransferase involved in cell wall biosynthesis
MANKAEWLLPVSTDLEKALIQNGLGQKHKVIRNVVDTDKFVFTPTTPNQFMVIADLENDQKNISGIIQAFYEFSKTNTLIQLTIAGGGKDEAQIKSEIKTLNLKEKVNLIGRVPADVLSDNLNRSYGLILFSNYENLPCVIVESFSCGTPVISTKVGGVGEIINNSNGVLINAKNQVELIEAMNFTIQKNWDKDLIRQFAIDNFSLDKIGKEFNEIYKSI